MALVPLKKLANIGRKYYLPYYISGQLAAWQGRVYLAQNRLDAADKLVLENDINPNGGNVLICDDLVVLRARLLIAKQRYTQASRVLEDLILPKTIGGSTSRLIEILALQALAKSAQGETDQAINALEQALFLAEPGGCNRIFVDEGLPMARLLYDALVRGMALGYVRRLLAAFPEGEIKGPEPEMQAESMEWIEPLSERELDVMHLIAEGLTNPQIAERLYLSLNTVKAHTRNIFGKLGATHRTQAGSKARSFGLLKTP